MNGHGGQARIAIVSLIAALALLALPATGAGIKTIKGSMTLTVEKQGDGSGLVLGHLSGNKVCAGGRQIQIQRDGQTIAQAESFLNGDYQAILPAPLLAGTYSALSPAKKDKLKGVKVRCAARQSPVVTVN
jgi:hypothetical protein